ncbi:MAG: type IV pilus assembly protein PilM [Bacillota bacterium]
MVYGSRNRAIGLELDTGAARAVELTQSGQGVKLTALGGISLPKGAVEEGMVLQPEEVGRALRTLWAARGIRGRQVLLGISNQGVLVRYATMPKVPPDKLENVVRYHGQEYLPIPLANVVLDYLVIGETTREAGEALEVLLVAARRDMLEGFMKALSCANLEPEDIDVSSLALTRVLPPVTGNMTVLTVNAANGLSNILITSRGMPRLARLVSVKMKDIADQLRFSLDEVLAGMAQPSEEKDAFLSAWFNNLAGEIRSSINYFQSQEDATGVEEIYINGRGARLPGIVEHLEDQLGIPVRKFNPLERYHAAAFKKAGFQGEALEYAISAGLALRGMGGCN